MSKDTKSPLSGKSTVIKKLVTKPQNKFKFEI